MIHFNQKFFKKCLVVLSFLCMEQTFAQDLLTIYQIAQQKNSYWTAQQFDYFAKQKDQPLAQGDLLPQIGLQSKIQHDYFQPKNRHIDKQNFSSVQVGLGLRQPLLRLDKKATLNKAKIASEINDIQLLQQHQQLTEQVILAYFGVLKAQAMQQSLQVEHQAFKAQYEMVQARFEQGLVAQIDVQEAYANLKNIESLLINHQMTIHQAKQQLSMLTGQMVDDIPPLKIPVNTELVAEKSIDEWLNKANQHNLELQLAQANVLLADQQQNFLKSHLYPKVDLVANVGWQNSKNALQMTSNGQHYQIAIEAEIPLYTGGRTQLGLEQGVLQKEAEINRLNFTKQNISFKTSEAYLNLMAHKNTITARQLAVEANAKVAEAAKTGYDLGMRSMVDNLMAQRQYHLTYRDFIQANFDYLSAYVALQKAVGQLDQQTVVHLNQQLQ